MAYPYTCQGAMDAMHYSATKTLQYYNLALNPIGDAYNHWLVGADHDAIYDIWLALGYVQQSAGYAGYGWSPFTNEGPWAFYMENCIAAGITMDDILTAMLQASYSELQKFIGIVDAYRVALWNEPFNVEFYAALARGFML